MRGSRDLRVSKNKREGGNSREKNTHPPQSAAPCWGMLLVPRKGSLSQCGGTGLCGAPLPGCGGEDGEAQEQSRGSRGHQSWEYREFSISGVSLVW